MSDNSTNRYQKLANTLIGYKDSVPTQPARTLSNSVMSYDMSSKNGNNVLYSFDNQADRDAKLQSLRQKQFLAYQAKRVSLESSMNELMGAAQVRIMYRDADLMDMWPDINAGLHIYAEEATVQKNGKVLNVYSKSPRTKAILEDLFYNRLDFNVMSPMIVRNTCKYGNEFMFLNAADGEGIIGWRRLDVHQMHRIESGLDNIYGNGQLASQVYNVKPDDVKFVWEGHNEQFPFQNWQVAHFRLIKDSIYLPYGSSILNGARRHWRILSMLEDAIFLHRIERSVERRIFKVNVGLINEADVPAFMEQFANNFKRASIVDPLTGQVDLRKNFLDVGADYFIPVRTGTDPTTIENLPSADFDKGMDDIEYFEKKILAIISVPKTFLNYTDSQGKGQNLALTDIRFNRKINSVQQAILMELTKIAMIHLYLLGFEDELTNFTLTMNNPSNQIELMELDNLNKRLAAASSALAEQGGGIPLMSWHQVQKEILGRTDDEIAKILNEIRLENAIANELQMTNQIIKKTGLFNQVDRIYGEPGAKYSEAPNNEGGPGGPGGFGGPSGGFGGPDLGGGFGDDLGDLGAPGGEEEGEIGGDESTADMDSGAPLQESTQTAIDKYINEVLTERETQESEEISIVSKSILINEELTRNIQDIEKLMEKNDDIMSD